MPSRRRCLGALAALPLAACQAPQAPLQVGAIPFAGYSLLFLAAEIGLLDPRRVRLRELRSNTDVMRALTAGRLQAAALTLDEVITSVHGGLPLKVLAVLDVSAGADVVLARPPLRLPAEVRGRRVAVESSGVGALMLSAFLQAAGLRAADVQTVPTALPLSAEAYRSGRADVVVTAEPWARQLEAEGARRLFDSSAMPGRIVDVLVAHEHALRQQPEAVQALVDAHFQALARYTAEPQALAPRLAAWLQLPAAEVPLAFRGLRMPSREASAELLSPQGEVMRGLPALAALLQREGLTADTVDTRTLIDPRWLRPSP